MSSYLRRIALILASACLTACGGSGGSGPAVDVQSFTVAGGWHMAQLGLDERAFASESRFGSWTFDDADGFTAALRSNFALLFTELPEEMGTYTIDGDHLLEITPLSDPMNTIEGAFAHDRSAGIGIDMSPSQPGLLVMTHATTMTSPAAMLGNYHMVTLAAGSLGVTCFHARAAFDGVGLVDLPGDRNLNVDGFLFVATGQEDLPYEVDLDGSLRYASPQRVGGVTSDGEFAFAGGPTDVPFGTAFPEINVFVRESQAATASTLSGTYAYVELRRTADGRDTLTRRGTTTADGAGGYVERVEVIQNRSLIQRVTLGGETTRAYTVAGDGTLAVEATASLPRLVGAVSSSGRYAALTTPPNALGGSTVAGPSLLLLVRTSPAP